MTVDYKSKLAIKLFKNYLNYYIIQQRSLTCNYRKMYIFVFLVHY